MNIGDKIVVVNPITSFGDYTQGDTATITGFVEGGDLRVKWMSNILGVDPDVRLDQLHPEEVELAQD